MRSILLHIGDDSCLEARLQVALDLARDVQGHVTCLQTLPLDAGVPDDPYAALAGQLAQHLREAADALRERLERKLSIEEIGWSWLQEHGWPADQLLRRSGLCDVIVLGSSEAFRRTGTSALVGDVVLRARTPVLVVPPEARRFDSRGLALVAWDGSPEASRALRAAAPLLARASAVVLATVTGESGDNNVALPPTEGAEYLSRRGIACEMLELPAQGGSVADTLVQAAAFRKAAYLVMGAYGHSRLRETIWGGVTRELFSQPPLPILACH